MKQIIAALLLASVATGAQAADEAWKVKAATNIGYLVAADRVCELGLSKAQRAQLAGSVMTITRSAELNAAMNDEFEKWTAEHAAGAWMASCAVAKADAHALLKAN